MRASRGEIKIEEILQNNAIVIDGDKHNSLYDAKVIKEIYNIIKQDGLL